MKLPLPLTLLVLTALPAARGDLTPQMLRRAQTHIEQLLGPRRNPPPPPADPANPFTVPGAGQPAAGSDFPTPVTEADTLKRAAAALKINGFVQLQGIPHLIIDRLPYRENDLIAVKERTGTTYLRLKKITARNYILELNGKELQSSLNAR